MKLTLRKAYIGKPSQSRVIEAGTYGATDERLFGLADYLVINGHATVESDSSYAEETVLPVEETMPVDDVMVAEDVEHVDELNVEEPEAPKKRMGRPPKNKG